MELAENSVKTELVCAESLGGSSSQAAVEGAESPVCPEHCEQGPGDREETGTKLGDCP